jgi:membrane-associated phospholipid phosphatase
MVVNETDIDDAAEKLQEADAVVADAVRSYRTAPPVKLLSALSEIGDQPQVRLLSGTLFVAGLLKRDVRMVRAGARMLMAHELATAAKNFVKRRIDRTRPRSRGNDADAHKIKPGRHESKEETSFPSGHSAGAASAARAFTREFPEYTVPASAAAAGIALAQIPRCAHYPTDVGAGLLIGVASEAVVNAGWHAAEVGLAGLVRHAERA